MFLELTPNLNARNRSISSQLSVKQCIVTINFTFNWIFCDWCAISIMVKASSFQERCNFLSLLYSGYKAIGKVYIVKDKVVNHSQFHLCWVQAIHSSFENLVFNGLATVLNSWSSVTHKEYNAASRKEPPIFLWNTILLSFLWYWLCNPTVSPNSVITWKYNTEQE